MNKYTNLTLLNELAHIVIKEAHLSKRDRLILEMRLCGSTLEEVGNEFGISKERTRQIIIRVIQNMKGRAESLESDIRNSLLATGKIVFDDIKRESYTPIEMLNLSPRALNTLINGGVGSIEQLAICTESQLDNFRGMGVKALNEIRQSLWIRGYSLIASK